MSWPFLVIVGALVMWVAVCGMLSSLSGWSSLAGKYRAGARSRTPRKISGGRIGSVTYGGTLSLNAHPDGFTLSALMPFRIGHPPLFIPWSAVTESSGEFMGQKTIVFHVPTVPDSAIELPVATVDWLKAQQVA